jgi:hypothetical protein
MKRTSLNLLPHLLVLDLDLPLSKRGARTHEMISPLYENSTKPSLINLLRVEFPSIISHNTLPQLEKSSLNLPLRHQLEPSSSSPIFPSPQWYTLFQENLVLLHLNQSKS